MKKYIIIGFIGVLVGGLAAWFGRPTEYKEIVREKIVEKVVTVRQANVVTKKVTRSQPDGTTTVEETIVDKSTEVRDENRERLSSKETIKKSLDNRWQLTVGGGITGSGNFSYLAGVQKQFLGPISLGATVTTNQAFGISSSAIFGTLSWRF